MSKKSKTTAEESEKVTSLRDVLKKLETFNAGTVERTEITSGDEKAIAALTAAAEAGEAKNPLGSGLPAAAFRSLRQFLARVAATNTLEGISIPAIESAAYRRGLQRAGAETAKALQAAIDEAERLEGERRAQQEAILAALEFYYAHPLAKPILLAYETLLDNEDLHNAREHLADALRLVIQNIRQGDATAPEYGAWVLADTLKARQERAAA